MAISIDESSLSTGAVRIGVVGLQQQENQGAAFLCVLITPPPRVGISSTSTAATVALLDLHCLVAPWCIVIAIYILLVFPPCEFGRDGQRFRSGPASYVVVVRACCASTHCWSCFYWWRCLLFEKCNASGNLCSHSRRESLDYWRRVR
jgi:hypothetical protein